MDLIRFTDLECHYGAREVFSGASGVLRGGERIGLVGPNGAGKSSLLRLLAGVDDVHGGAIVRARGTRLRYLAQSVADATDTTLEAIMETSLARVPDGEWGLQRKRLHAMLAAFGFERAEFDRPLREFSGGQRAKAALVDLMVDDPDYVIVDEPTNHLDVSTIRWLETAIVRDGRSYVIVSHDRYFLDRVATRIWEIDNGTLHAYEPANHAYTDYVRQRDERIAAQRLAYQAYVDERDKRRASIAGLRATLTSSNYSRVRSREKQLARIEEQTAVEAPAEARSRVNVRLEATRRSTNGWAVEIKGLSKAYDKPLFSDLTFDVQQGARIAVVGPNGAGKSTLLKIAGGMVEADAGEVRFNPALHVGYFAQNANDQLDDAHTAVEAVLDAGAPTPEEARRLLGRMNVSGDEGDKLVGAFSGGERRRIMLARLMARRSDVLLLDEPSNDLDIASQEALESVLAEYPGTLLIVSHDRYLLERLCDRVVWIEDGAWGAMEGGYDAYEAMERDRESGKGERDAVAQAPRAKGARQTPLKTIAKLKNAVAKAERDIERLDARKAEIDAMFATVEIYEDRTRVRELQAELDAIAARYPQALTEWEGALHKLEAVDAP